MAINFEDIAIRGPKQKREHGGPGIPFHQSEKMKRYLNPIDQGQYYAIGGRMSGGKRSFTDLHFVFGTFRWWFDQPEAERPPLKIIYYNMDKSEKQKMQKMLCTFMWLYHSQLMDINTLNGMHSRMFAVTKNMETLIDSAGSFFRELFNVLDVRSGVTNPGGIYNDVVRYMMTVGTDTEDSFTYNEGYGDQITLVIVDDVKKLKMESKGGSQHSDVDMHTKLNSHMVTLRDHYKVTPVVVVPSWEIPGVFRLNQMIPDFREFKYYFDDCNVVLHLFNPYKFGIKTYNGWESGDYVSCGDNIARFRVCSILKNTDGADSSQLSLFFIPENGVFMDLAPKSDEKLSQAWIEYAKDFKNQQINLTYAKG